MKKISKGYFFNWSITEFDSTSLLEISCATGFSIPVAQVLFSRGLTTASAVEKFVFVDSSCVSDPTLLFDAQKAANRLDRAIFNKEKILIFGDYDVDGMTSTSIAFLSLKACGANVSYFLPNRVRHGYGLSVAAVKAAAKNGVKVILTVDNGTTSLEAAFQAREVGIDLIITDHHKPKHLLPDVYALVNPHQPSCQYPFKNFCGAGVVFKLMTLLLQMRKVPIPKKVRELCLLGTIADVVELASENRFMVKQGLRELLEEVSFSTATLAKNAGIDPEKKQFWTSSDIGFGLAPQLNALGRLDDPNDAIKFLTCSDENLILEIGKKLLEVNKERKNVDAEILQSIQAQIRAGFIDLNKSTCIFAHHTDWPAGVVGLVASKLVAAHGRPTFVLHKTESGILKGSARSIAEFDLFAGLTECDDLLISYGGHPAAAGLSLAQENLPELWSRLDALVNQTVEKCDLVPKIKIDASLALDELNKNFFNQMMLLEPFGQGNPTPQFLIKGLRLVKPPQIFKEKHVRLTVFDSGVLKPVVFFNRPEVAQILAEKEDCYIDLVCRIDFQIFREQFQINLIGVDFAIKNDLSS